MSFEDADKLHKAFEEVQNIWNGNEEAKEQFFTKYPSYYFWLKDAPEAQDLEKSHLGGIWGMIPGEFRDQWSYIDLSFKDADKLHKAFEEVQNNWNGNEEAKEQFFRDYPSYYFWLKDAPEANDLNESHLGTVWGMIPYDFRDKWSKINLPFKDADKLHKAFEEVQNNWNGNEEAKEQFFRDYPNYYLWLKNAPEANDLNKSHLGGIWGMIPDKFRSKNRHDNLWGKITLSFKYADKLYLAFEEIQKNWKGNGVVQAQFFAKYPSYYFWLKNAPEANGLEKSHLGHVWGMIPGEFRDQWSYINLSFRDADKLYKAFEGVQNSWNVNDEEKDEFFTKYPSYYFWFKDSPEARSLKKSNLGQVWGMIPGEFRDQWSYIGLPFNDADKLYKAFEGLQNSWNGNDEEKDEFFAKYPSYYFWLKNAPEANGLEKSHLGHVWGMIPYDFRDKWSYIGLPFNDADKLYKAFEELQNSWNGNDEEKDEFFTKYPSYYFWLNAVAKERGLKKSHLGSVWGMIPGEFRDQWSMINLPFKDADKLHAAILDDSKTWCANDSRTYMQHFAQTNLQFGWYWGLIPTSLRDQFNLEYYHPGKIFYKDIKVDSKQEFAVLRVFEEVLDYQPEVGVNFQVEVDSNRRYTFDFKIEYQEEDSHVTHFFEWHPVFVSFNGGRNDARKLDEFKDIAELIDDDYLTDCDLYAYAQELTEQEYYDERLELLFNTTYILEGELCLTCATAGGRTGGLTKNLETLHGFLRQAKPDLELTLVELTYMFKGYLQDARDYEVESVN